MNNITEKETSMHTYKNCLRRSLTPAQIGDTVKVQRSDHSLMCNTYAEQNKPRLLKLMLCKMVLSN